MIEWKKWVGNKNRKPIQFEYYCCTTRISTCYSLTLQVDGFKIHLPRVIGKEIGRKDSFFILCNPKERYSTLEGVKRSFLFHLQDYVNFAIKKEGQKK